MPVLRSVKPLFLIFYQPKKTSVRQKSKISRFFFLTDFWSLISRLINESVVPFDFFPFPLVYVILKNHQILLVETWTDFVDIYFMCWDWRGNKMKKVTHLTRVVFFFYLAVRRTFKCVGWSNMGFKHEISYQWTYDILTCLIKQISPSPSLSPPPQVSPS